MTEKPLAYIELSKSNLIHNIKQFRDLAHKNTKIIAVLKANAYGHGLAEVVKILDAYVDYFQVDSIEELVTLRTISKKKTYMFGYVQESDLAHAMKLGCILSVFSLPMLLEVNKKALKNKLIQEIHIPIDAHLGREGFLLHELPNLFENIKKCKAVKLSGLYAHFANIEDTADFSHAQKQIREYQSALDIAQEYGFSDLQTHISATSGLLVYEKSLGLHPLVRIGIGTYGLWPSEHLRSVYAKNKKIVLKPVLSWKTKIAQIKTLPKSATIGYGLTYKAKRELKVAIIPQGYSNGLDRGLSNVGYVLVARTKCPILGRVMMNMFVVDVSHIKDVQPEDEVVLLGTQGKLTISAEDIAKKIDSINYEVVTRISPLIPRSTI